MITAESVRRLRHDALRLPPDHLTRCDLYSYRAWFIRALFVLERTLAEHEGEMQPIPDVQNVTIFTAVRALISVMFTALLIGVLVGGSAGVAVGVYRCIVQLLT